MRMPLDPRGCAHPANWRARPRADPGRGRFAIGVDVDTVYLIQGASISCASSSMLGRHPVVASIPLAFLVHVTYHRLCTCNGIMRELSAIDRTMRLSHPMRRVGTETKALGWIEPLGRLHDAHVPLLDEIVLLGRRIGAGGSAVEDKRATIPRVKGRID